MKKHVTARPCKEQKNWEIVDCYGDVCNKHYNSKQECIKEARKMAEEYGCELEVEENMKKGE